MATIPLPALHTAPIEQPASPLQMMGQMMQIKNAQQEQAQRQAMAPLQLQDAQLDLEKKQRQAQDEKALHATMQQWGQPATPGQPSSGATAATPGQPAPASAMPSYDDLVPLAIKNGASFQAVQGLQAHVLEMKDKASQIAKNDAETGTANANAMKTKNGMIVDAMTSVMNLPDDQLAEGLARTAQQLGDQRLLDPQHVQMANQLAVQAQGGDAAGARKQISLYSSSLGGFSKLLDDAQKKAQLQTGQLGLADKQGAAAYSQQHGLPQGVPVETQEMGSWLSQNPGKSPADYAVAMKKIVPAYNFNLQQQAAAGAGAGPGGAGSVAQHYGMTQAAFDQLAEKFASTGLLPPIGRSANGLAMNRDLMNRSAELHPNAVLATNSAEYKANTASLAKLQTNFDQVQAFEQTAEKNMDLLQQTAAKIPDLGTRFMNVPVRQISGSMIGTDNMAAFKTALNTAQTEAAKVLNSSNASGVLSDSARHELQEVIDGSMPLSAMVASLNTLKQDMGNRTTAYQAQIQVIQGRLKGPGQAQPGGGADFFTSHGGVQH